MCFQYCQNWQYEDKVSRTPSILFLNFYCFKRCLQKSSGQSISTDCMIVINIRRDEATLFVFINTYYITGSFTLMFDGQAYSNSISYHWPCYPSTKMEAIYSLNEKKIVLGHDAQTTHKGWFIQWS